MKTLRSWLFLLILPEIIGGAPALANHIQVTGVAIGSQNKPAKTTNIGFTPSWDNSWSDGVNNDAAWVFVKYQDASGIWRHPTLISANSGLTPDGKGVFSASGSNIDVVWNYGADGIRDFDLVVVKVFAVEMVYNPTADFLVGDPNAPASGPAGSFYTSVINGAYDVSSEGAVTVGTASGNLYYNSGGDQTGPIPAAYPKGYSGFYSMKYEISEGQYVDFLNTLTPAQAANRFSAGSTGSRYSITVSAGVYSTSRPDRACNFLSWSDGIAYADWAGLRPMTELEFEKASRGPLAPVADEYAWGNTGITVAGTISGTENGTETISTAGANCNFGSPTFSGGDAGQGPLRNGIFATGSSTRSSAGASYFGSMEMSGNLWEQVVTVGNSGGRAFTGNNGDGTLDASGDANVANWPTSSGSGLRGGSFNTSGATCKVADRSSAATSATSRNADVGFRCVRSF